MKEIKQLLESPNEDDKKLAVIIMLKTLTTEECKSILGSRKSGEIIGGNYKYNIHYKISHNIGYKYENRIIFFGCEYLELVDKKLDEYRYKSFNYNKYEEL